MPVFLEKVVLPVGVALITGLVLINPMKFDWSSRISLFIGVLALGYFVAHQLHLRNEGIRLGSDQSADTPAQVVQDAKDCSQNLSGNNNTAKIDCDDKGAK